MFLLNRYHLGLIEISLIGVLRNRRLHSDDSNREVALAPASFFGFERKANTRLANVLVCIDDGAGNSDPRINKQRNGSGLP